MKQGPFRYQPLQPGHIRLLRLEPASTQDAPLRGALIHTALQTSAIYEALSYTWGDRAKPFFITVEDKGIIAVTANLQSALVNLRHPSESRTVWIDQICINQSDTAERNAQVAMMTQIYMLAKRVMIWVGDMDPETKVALDFLPVMLEKVRQVTPDSSYPAKDPAKTLGLMVLGSPAWKGISQIFARPYFRRVWIVQEVVLANGGKGGAVVKCGPWEGEWEDLALASRQFQYNNQYFDDAHDAMNSINEMRLARHREGRKRKLIDVLFETYFLHVGNPRDKVFGIMGLTDEDKLNPDYALTIEEVYRNTARHLIEGEDALEVLRCVAEAKTLKVPSWVPDWMSEISIRARIPESVNFVKMATSPHTYAFSTDGMELSVSAVVLGTIDVVSEVYEPNSEPKSLAVWINLAQKLISTTGKNFPECYWRALLGTDDSVGTSEVAKEGERCYEAWQNALDTRILRKNVPSLLEEGKLSNDELNERTNAFYNLMELRCVGRRLMQSTEGFLVLGPKTTKPGDIVCAVKQCSTPLVIRVNGAGAGTLIGDCYAQGFMSGSNIDWANAGRTLRLI